MTTATKPQILSVTISRELDECPDTSWIGEYSDNPGPDAIDRQERGDMRSREYRYFVPAMTAEQTGSPESPEQDYQRMESLKNGDWCFIGIRASADVVFADGIIQEISSGGLWGIESDSDDDYLQSVVNDELDALRCQLEAIGFDSDAIDAAIEDADRSDL